MLRPHAFALLVASVLAGTAVAAAPLPGFEPIKTSPPAPNRHVSFTKLAAEGPLMTPLAATTFGSLAHEEFLDAGQLPDGTLVAFGNAWGPQFPDTPAPTILGHGKHLGLSPALATRGKDAEAPRRDDPDAAGFVAFYSPDLKTLQRVVRFDWGVASLITAKVAPDGKGLILLGRATSAFRDWARTAKIDATTGTGAYTYGTTPCTGDIFIARLSADATALTWATLLPARGSAYDRLWFDAQGQIFFDAKGLYRLSADGQTLTKLSDRTATGTAKWLLVDADGASYFGGDRNTHTRREPYRQPYLYKFNSAGKQVATLYQPSPADIGSDCCGLESDSSIRTMTRAADGTLILTGWSDGANSVLPRQARDFKHYAPEGGFGMLPWWPKGASSFAHIMQMDPATFETRSHQWWVGYIPTNFESERHRNAPSAVHIDYTTPLADGSLAFTGRAATGLIQTPNAFWMDPQDGQRHGGTYVTVLDATLKNFRFSSYLPDCANPRLAATKDGVLVVSRATGLEAPSLNPLQKPGGPSDAHLILLQSPGR